MMLAFNLLLLIFSIVDIGIAKPGEHFLIETDDAPEEETDDAPQEDGSDKSNDYAIQREIKDCEPNKKWKEGCQSCSCTPNGKEVVCDALGCQDGNSNDYAVGREKKDCEANKKWKEGCKSCTCQPDGKEVVCSDLECRYGN